MTRYLGRVHNSRLRNPVQSSGDSLQVDVMRFMAILGLCLTAILTVVRSLPLNEPVDSMAVQEIGTKSIAEPVSTKILSDIPSEAKIPTPASVSRTRLVDAVAGPMEQTIEQGMPVPGAVAGPKEQTIEQGMPTPGAVAGPKEQTDKEGVPLDETLPASKSGYGSAGTVDEAPVESIPAEGSQSTDTHDNSLRFESVTALERLMKSGKLGLFVMKGKQAWRMSLDSTGPEFTPVKFPSRFYEMSESTVPGVYQMAFQRIASRTVSTPSQWGVQLPGRTEQQIAHWLNRGGGGMLVIEGNGNVISGREQLP
ncbi:MAG: hypothetical protein GY703_15700 [Gammaproteobacteria bacterium]|nr:hypothetical protein [Gammaproteobacteria bacterium]